MVTRSRLTDPERRRAKLALRRLATRREESLAPGQLVRPFAHLADAGRALGTPDALSLQRLIGNHATTTRLQRKGEDVDAVPDLAPPTARPAITTYSIPVSYQLRATIRQRTGPERRDTGETAGRAVAAAQRDADSAEEGAAEEKLQKEEGEIEIEEGDSVAPTLTYSPSIAVSATAPGASEFGVTRTNPRVAGVAVVHDTAATKFDVTATVNNNVTWSVHSLGRTDIPDENAPAITAANYATVASDLTPNMASDGGRPPRTRFWAKDLTERHEQFHANERAHTYGRPAFEFAQTWLSGQTAANEAEVRALVNQVPTKMHENYATAYAPGKETRAYGDGAPLYRARADAVKAKGDSGGYGAPPGP